MGHLVVVCALEDAGGGVGCAAMLACALAAGEQEPTGVVLVEGDRDRSRGPTLLASDHARRIEGELRAREFDASARGRLAWVTLTKGADWGEAVAAVIGCGQARVVVVCAPPRRLAEVIGAARGPVTVVIRAELPRQRALASLAVRELTDDGVAVRLMTRAPGRVATRRALAGIDPGGEAGRRAARLAQGLVARPSPGSRMLGRLAAEAGQALPLVLGALVALIACALVLTAFGGAVSGASRAQRAADLAALSAARSMRDDFNRLFAPVELADGRPNPAHLEKSEYLDSAEAAAVEAADRNGVAPARVAVEFPDGESVAPLQVRVEVNADLVGPGGREEASLETYAIAEAAPPSTGTEETAGPAMASGGGYSGPLIYRQGEGMRPDVAQAFDRMAAAAARDGLTLLINSAFRSDAEQAILFAENPDPRMVAPPGTSLHRCATELDLGPSAAYGWLAANAGGFGFVQRYSWEAWHYGFDAGPAPCSTAGESVTGSGSAQPRGTSSDGASGEVSLPAFVPARYRAAIAAAAQRWNVSGALLAAQLMAESNFNPFAVSPVGAAGIAQFMPATAAAYGLTDRFDPEASINAQAHLMSDLLEQFGDPALALAAYNAGPGAVAPCSCVPPYLETQAYVARILGLMGGAGAIAVTPTLEVRLVE